MILRLVNSILFLCIMFCSTNSFASSAETQIEDDLCMSNEEEEQEVLTVKKMLLQIPRKSPSNAFTYAPQQLTSGLAVSAYLKHALQKPHTLNRQQNSQTNTTQPVFVMPSLPRKNNSLNGQK